MGKEVPTGNTPEQPLQLEAIAGRELMTYDPEFDTQIWTAFNKLSYQDPLMKEQEKQKLVRYTDENLKTMLGERFHVLLSKLTYEIRDGRLYSPLWNEPLLNVFQRGQEHRKKNGSTPDDQEREAAEVTTFAANEQRLTSKKIPKRAIILVVQPPGKPAKPGMKASEYQHNFYDILMKEDDETVSYRRYSSGLSIAETLAKARSLDPWFAKHELAADRNFLPDDVFFLQNPIYLDPTANPHLSPEAIHKFFHRETGYMGEEEFSYILAACKGYIDVYIKIVSENPTDRQIRNLAFNALLNRADDVAAEFKRIKEQGKIAVIYDKNWASMPAQEQLVTLGTRAVREVKTGCGTSGGMSLVELVDHNPINDITRSRWSVSDYGVLEYSGELGYSFDDEHPQNCKKCGNKAGLGPCGICRGCDRDLRQRNGEPLPIQLAA